MKNEVTSNKTNKLLKRIIWFFMCLLLIAVIGGAIYFYKLSTDYYNTEFSVVFDAGDLELSQTEFKLKRNNCITLPVLEKEGYSFDGWFCDDVKWEDNTPITKNVNLVAKFTPKKYKITFIVDDESFIYFADYDSFPVFPDGTPTKQPTETTQFDFVGFEPKLETVKGETSYTAKFEENIRKFDVNLTSNYQNACTFVGNQKVEYDGSVTIDIVENVGYNFVAWCDGDEVFSTEKQVKIDNIKKDINLIAKFDLINYSIIYVCDEDIINNNITNYNVSMGNVPLKEISKSGYVFKGWFTKQNGQGEKVEVLNISVLSANPKLYAYFTQNITISFVIDGFELKFDNFETTMGQPFSVPQIDTSKYGMSAYNIDGFYLQSDCNQSSKIDETTILTDNTTLYGKWQYILDNGFFAYKAEFDKAKTTKSVYINSEEKFVCFIDYIRFYNILNNDIKISFGSDYNISFSTEEELQSYLTTIFNEKSDYPNGIRLSYTYTKRPYKLISVCVFENNSSLLATKNADPTYSEVNQQYEYAFLTASSKRASDFDDFNINKITQTITVSSSNQLVYALEKGYRPVPESGSNAEKIYNKAKDILREICDDNMTEFEKIKAIYDWLILNVQYDSKAANSSEISNSWTLYDAWYPEGVFFNHKAVCDGIARSLLILARIENIATIRVSGEHSSNGTSVGHAWNKVFIDGNWYGIDATHGNVIVANGNYEVLTYSSFLFTDNFKHICCSFETKEGTETQTSGLNVYANISFGEGVNSFDLYINSIIEFNNLVNYVNSYVSNSDYYQGNTNHAYFTIEFALAENCGIDINYVCVKLKVSSYLKSKACGDIEAYCFVIKF